MQGSDCQRHISKPKTYTITKIVATSGYHNLIYSTQNNEISRELPIVFGIADDILLAVYDTDGMHYDRTLKCRSTIKKT